jgi:hypothetical protein
MKELEDERQARLDALYKKTGQLQAIYKGTL